MDPNSMSTPDQSKVTPFKMAASRVSLLTGSAKRTTPYKIPDSIDRRQRLFPVLTRDEMNQSLRDVTIESLNVPEGDSLDSTSGSMNIKKACLDWRLVNKEAEVIRLKTQQTQLQSLISSIKESSDKLRIEQEKEVKDLQNQLSQSRQNERNQERRIIELESEIEGLQEERQLEQQSLLPEREHHESLVTKLQLNECKLRGDIQDLKQEIKSLEYKHGKEVAELKHELKCKDIQVNSLEEAKKVFERNHTSLREEAQQSRHLRLEMNKLMTEIDSLRNQLKDFEDGQTLTQLLQSQQSNNTNDQSF